MQKIQIKYLRDIEPIKVIENSDWVDLRAACDCTIPAGSYLVIPLGIAVKLPKGYSAIIAPRSCMLERFGIIQANSIGVIDNSYSGERDEWKIPVIAFRDTKILKNQRICQFTLIKKRDFELETVQKLHSINRGGFGSTGIE